MPLVHEIVNLTNAVRGTASRVYARATQGTGDGTRNIGDQVPVVGLGMTSMPHDESATRGVLLRNVSGAVGVVVAAWANKLGDLVGQLVPGDTCVHGTGPNHGTRLFLKEQVIELVITGGDDDNDPDVLVQIDRSAKKAQIAIAGHVAELSEQNGLRIDAAGGQASIIMKDDQIWLKCGKLLLSDTPIQPIATVVQPPTVPPVAAPLPSILGPAPAP